MKFSAKATIIAFSLALFSTTCGASVRSPERDNRWRQDIAVARDEFLSKDLSFSDMRRAEARRRLDRLSRAVPSLSDQEIVAEMARVAALADNAHTRVYLLRNRGWWRRYPVRIWKFADGWRVIAVRPGLESLLGGKIERIGGQPIATAEAHVRPLYAGVPTWARYMASYTLTSPDALLGTDVIRGDGSAELVVHRDRQRIASIIRPLDEPKRQIPEESWWFLSPLHAAASSWTTVLKPTSLPEYLAQPNRWYDLRRCSNRVMYLPFTRSEDQPGRPSLGEFTSLAVQQLAGSPAGSRLIVDLRFNTGGDLTKTRSFFEELAKSAIGQTRGRLFVIQGPSTFSAGITPAAILKQDSKAIFVGSPPGDRMRFWAEGGNVTLPNSGINMHYANGAHLYAAGGPPIPDDLIALRLNAGSLVPDLPVDATFAAYRAGRDPVTEKIVGSPLRCG